MGKLYWQGKYIYKIAPRDYNVRTVSGWLRVNEGTNRLAFQGFGTSDSYGLTINNVQLIREGTSTNICVNGGFEQPYVGSGWKVYNQIPGWRGSGFEIGSGHHYNRQWKDQVCELDGHQNGYLLQLWNFDRNYRLN